MWDTINCWKCSGSVSAALKGFVTGHFLSNQRFLHRLDVISFLLVVWMLSGSLNSLSDMSHGFTVKVDQFIFFFSKDSFPVKLSYKSVPYTHNQYLLYCNASQTTKGNPTSWVLWYCNVSAKTVVVKVIQCPLLLFALCKQQNFAHIILI